MDGGKNGEQLEKVEVDFPHQAARMLGNQMVEVAVGAEGVFIGGKKPCAEIFGWKFHPHKQWHGYDRHLDKTNG